MKIDQKKYEIGFLALTEAGQQDVMKILADHNVEIIKEGEVSRIKLSYPIKKENFGFFGYVQFICKPSEILVIKDELKFLNSLLRNIIIVDPVIAKTAEETAKEAVETASEGEQVADEKQSASKAQPKHAVELSNEELEKKLEEILK